MLDNIHNPRIPPAGKNEWFFDTPPTLAHSPSVSREARDLQVDYRWMVRDRHFLGIQR